MDATTIATYVREGQAIGDQILSTVAGVDPGVALPAATAGVVLDLTAQLVVKALTAWATASGTPISAESIIALLPDPAPLTEPDA